MNKVYINPVLSHLWDSGIYARRFNKIWQQYIEETDGH